MKQSEADMVGKYINMLQARISDARNEMRKQNFGTAFDILSEPYDVLQCKIDEYDVFDEKMAKAKRMFE